MNPLIPYVVLVTGSRNLEDYELVHEQLTLIRNRETSKYLVVVEGGGHGADSWARHACSHLGGTPISVAANWDSFERAAGPLRNQLMLDLFDIDEALAFPGPNSKGTWDMVNRLKKAGIKVTIIEEKSNE